MSPASFARLALPLWRRLAVRLALAFALLTFLSVVIVGVLVRERQKRELEDAVGTQLLNIARVAVLLVDPAEHAALGLGGRVESAVYRRLRATLAAVQREVLLTTPIRTLVAYDRPRRRARVVVTSEEGERPGEWYALAPELIDPIGTVTRGAARLTRIHLTSVDAADQAVLAGLVERVAAPADAPAVSNATEAPR